MRPIEEICSQATTEFYNELALTSQTRSVKKLRTVIRTAYSQFIPNVLPQYLAKFSGDIFNQADIGVAANQFTGLIGGQQRELAFNSARRAWGSTDEMSVTRFAPHKNGTAGPLIGQGGLSETIPKGARPKSVHGLCVVEISLDWLIDRGDNYNHFTFPVENIPDISAICIRVPAGLRLPFVGVSRIANLAESLARSFYTWMIETISDAIRKKAVQLSSQLYRRPRVLIKDIAPTLAFSCLTSGQDFVLFDDQSLTGFMEVIERSEIPTGTSSLKLSGILLGEIVEKNQSAISYVLDKREGEFIEIDLREDEAYSNDEALKHAINIAWEHRVVCLKLFEYRESVFVLFFPQKHQARVTTYVKENLNSIQSEIKSSFGHIMSYVRLIEELRLGSLFDQEPLKKAEPPNFISRFSGKARSLFSDKTTRDQVVQTVGSLLRKFFGLP